MRVAMCDAVHVPAVNVDAKCGKYIVHAPQYWSQNNSHRTHKSSK